MMDKSTGISEPTVDLVPGLDYRELKYRERDARLGSIVWCMPYKFERSDVERIQEDE